MKGKRDMKVGDVGYIVHSPNGRGKTYFFYTIDEAQKELKKHSSWWKLDKGEIISLDPFGFQVIKEG